jgi:hypothetical protein
MCSLPALDEPNDESDDAAAVSNVESSRFSGSAIPMSNQSGESASEAPDEHA